MQIDRQREGGMVGIKERQRGERRRESVRFNLVWDRAI